MTELTFENGQIVDAAAVCSSCDSADLDATYNYCPYCGADL